MLDTKTRKITDPKFISSEKHLEILNTLFERELEYNYGELKTNLMEKFNLGRDASERFIAYYIDKNWITKERRGKSSYHKYNVNASSFFYNPN